MVTVKAIIPKKLLTSKNADKLIEGALDEAAKFARGLYEGTTSTWNHKPDFKIDGRSRSRHIYTTDEIYGYVDLGTKRHIIRPRLRRRVGYRTSLRWGRPFSPKTFPGTLRAFTGVRGTDYVYAKQVKHPGTKARRFSRAVARDTRPVLKDELRKAVKKIADGD